jgi:hypothetical protein
MSQMMEDALMLAEILFHKKWELFECSREVFITSDNPLSAMQPEGMPYAEVDGFLNLKAVLPISPSRSLVLDNGLVSNTIDILETDRQRVLNINRSTMFQAYREIYSNRNSRGINKAFNKTKEGESEKAYVDGYDGTKE